MNIETTFPMPEIHLFHDRKKCRKFLDSLGWAWNPLDSKAQTWCEKGGDGRFHAVMLFEADGTWHNEAALLAHEAVHVAEAFGRYLGIDDEEFRAYMVQTVSLGLFKAHDKWKRKRYERS